MQRDLLYLPNLSAIFVCVSSTKSVLVTPHDLYSSSIGVLGCKIYTNRVAYWPEPISCDDIYVKLSYSQRSAHLLRIDSSTSAYDISYDARNYLGFGVSATVEPKTGGGIAVDYEYVSADECRSLLEDGKLPLSAPNSMNYLETCLEQKKSWVAQNYELVNIMNSDCQFGYDEICSFTVVEPDQPICPHTLGAMHQPTGLEVKNIMYGTGLGQTACN